MLLTVLQHLVAKHEEFVKNVFPLSHPPKMKFIIVAMLLMMSTNT
jgi:hypothetical protein